MYEMIMSLPLFKGISRDHVSALLEKTNIVFHRFSVGETVISPGEDCRNIGFVVRGTARVEFRSPDGDVTLGQSVGPGTVIGADSLYGWETSFPFSAVALTPMSILVFTKEEYLRLLHQDDIYLMNYLNYLSLRSQNSCSAIRDFESKGVLGLAARWVLSMTTQYSSDITLTLSGAAARLLESDRAAIAKAEAAGVVSLDGDTLSIAVRREFLDSLTDPS